MSKNPKGLSVRVTCTEPQCANGGKRINTITGFATVTEALDLVEQWADAHEAADTCPKCGQLGEPMVVQARKRTKAATWMTDNDRRQATEFLRRLSGLTLEQLAAFITDMQCVNGEVREYLLADGVHAAFFAGAKSSDGIDRAAQWADPKDYAKRYARLRDAYGADKELDTVAMINQMDDLELMAAPNRFSSSSRMLDMLQADDEIVPYAGVPGSTPQAVNRQVVVTVKGGMVVDVQCPPSVEVTVIDHGSQGGGRREATWSASTPLNAESLP